MKYLLFLSLCLFAFSIHGQKSYLYITESNLLQAEFEIIGSYNNKDFVSLSGCVLSDDINKIPIFAGVSLLLEIDGTLYKTKYEKTTNTRGTFTLKHPKFIYKNKKIRKFLKIGRIGYKTELINIDKYRKADTMEIVLKKQIATFPSVRVEGNNYYVDFSNLYTNAGKFPSLSSFNLLYNQLCEILSKDDSWRSLNKIEYFFEFDEEGTLININSTFQNKTLIDFFKKRTWSSPKGSHGNGIPLDASLTIYNTMK